MSEFYSSYLEYANLPRGDKYILGGKYVKEENYLTEKRKGSRWGRIKDLNQEHR
jgi:hypothetical protein